MGGQIFLRDSDFLSFGYIILERSNLFRSSTLPFGHNRISEKCCENDFKSGEYSTGVKSKTLTQKKKHWLHFPPPKTSKHPPQCPQIVFDTLLATEELGSPPKCTYTFLHGLQKTLRWPPNLSTRDEHAPLISWLPDRNFSPTGIPRCISTRDTSVSWLPSRNPLIQLHVPGQLPLLLHQIWQAASNLPNEKLYIIAHEAVSLLELCLAMRGGSNVLNVFLSLWNTGCTNKVRW